MIRPRPGDFLYSERHGDQDKAKLHLDIHAKVLSARVKIHKLEREAGRKPNDSAIRKEIAALYQGIGAKKHAAYWQRIADQLGDAPN